MIPDPRFLLLRCNNIYAAQDRQAPTEDNEPEQAIPLKNRGYPSMESRWGIRCFRDLTIKIWPRDRPIAEKPVGKMSVRIEYVRY